jgi:hypothetical protein
MKVIHFSNSTFMMVPLTKSLYSPIFQLLCRLIIKYVLLFILLRFENIVMGQFHGHEHTDYFSLYYDPNNKTRATSVAFTAGSATSYTDVNPNYRVYTIEAEGDFVSNNKRVYQYFDHSKCT